MNGATRAQAAPRCDKAGREERLLTATRSCIARATFALVLVLAGTTDARADPAPRGETEPGPADTLAFKLTPSVYRTTNLADAADINLRGNFGPHAAWLGYYRRGGEFEQTRAGYEYTLQLPFGQLVPSLQVASRRFAGGSINLQAGDLNYLLAGLGRTNVRDYYNLNFDPNDAVTVGVGTRMLPKSNLTYFVVRDDRLHTGQKVTHLVWRYVPAEHQRLTIDLSRKRGQASADDAMVSGGALSVTWDYRDVFLRVARDRKVNFTSGDQSRVSLGLRF